MSQQDRDKTIRALQEPIVFADAVVDREPRGNHPTVTAPATVDRVQQQCDDCPCAEVTSTFPGFGRFCAECAATRALRPGGLPEPPAAPDPVTIKGPDGRSHHLEFQVQRYATGTGVELVERGGGYHFSTISTIGRHDQPIHAQVRHLRQLAEDTIGNVQLEPHAPDGRLLLSTGQVVGRLVWPRDADDYQRRPYNVMVDGLEMTWEELGRAMEPYEGFRFRLIVEDNIDEIHDGKAS